MRDVLVFLADGLMVSLGFVCVVYAVVLFVSVFGDREYTLMRDEHEQWRAVRPKPVKTFPPTKRLPAVKVIQPKSFW